MEQWDAYDLNDQKIGYVLTKGQPIPEGMYQLVCEVLVRHFDGSYLCMKRSMKKKPHMYPGWYEATAGGAALCGETVLQGVKRELFEETGIVCDIFEQINRTVAAPCIFKTFLCHVNCPKDSVVLQEGETEDYIWMTEQEFIEFVNSDRIIPNQKLRYMPYFQQMGYCD